MTTPLTVDVVLDVVQNLSVAFQGKRTADDLKRLSFVYFDALGTLSSEAVRWAAKRAILEDVYFPKVSRLVELGQKWTQHARSAGANVVGAIDDPMFCPRCQSRFEDRRRWRPQVDPESGRWLTSADGQYVLLELYDRLLCDCAPRCAYLPDPHASIDVMPVSAMPFARPTKRTTVVVERAA